MRYKKKGSDAAARDAAVEQRRKIKPVSGEDPRVFTPGEFVLEPLPDRLKTAGRLREEEAVRARIKREAEEAMKKGEVKDGTGK